MKSSPVKVQRQPRTFPNWFTMLKEYLKTSKNIKYPKEYPKVSQSIWQYQWAQTCIIDYWWVMLKEPHFAIKKLWSGSSIEEWQIWMTSIDKYR